MRASSAPANGVAPQAWWWSRSGPGPGCATVALVAARRLRVGQEVRQVGATTTSVSSPPHWCARSPGTRRRWHADRQRHQRERRRRQRAQERQLHLSAVPAHAPRRSRAPAAGPVSGERRASIATTSVASRRRDAVEQREAAHRDPVRRTEQHDGGGCVARRHEAEYALRRPEYTYGVRHDDQFGHVASRAAAAPSRRSTSRATFARRSG